MAHQLQHGYDIIPLIKFSVVEYFLDAVFLLLFGGDGSEDNNVLWSL